jgi:hypothetical protein
MVNTVQRRKIEILCDAPLVRRVVALAEAAGVTGYTLCPLWAAPAMVAAGPTIRWPAQTPR